MLGTPVPVVFFRMPVASPANDVPLIFTTVAALADVVTSPVSAARLYVPAVLTSVESVVRAACVSAPLEPMPVRNWPAVTVFGNTVFDQFDELLSLQVQTWFVLSQ